MFDVGFSEMVVLAVVALIVIGPERLPTVARTVGALLGRLNRYVADVKSDVEREMRLDEMKKLRAEVEQQAMSIEQSVVGELEVARKAVEQPAAEVQQSLADVMQETGQTGVDIQQALSGMDVTPEGFDANLQYKSDNATLPATSAVKAESSIGSPLPTSKPQPSLDFDAFNDSAPVVADASIPGKGSATSVAAKA